MEINVGEQRELVGERRTRKEGGGNMEKSRYTHNIHLYENCEKNKLRHHPIYQ